MYSINIFASCGNGTIDSSEECDDGNTSDFDGCSGFWGIEDGWNWNVGVSPNVCTPICGDGLTVGTEQWDDNNITPGDGWSATCQLEIGWSWDNLVTPSLCTPICGDSMVYGTEVWDDGNTLNVDGWNFDWTAYEAGFTCIPGTTTTPTVCTDTCGDGYVMNRVGIQCDDGNLLNGDGWASDCTIEYAYQCDGGSQYNPDNCYNVCGDGLYNANHEQWDDGNTNSNDGWSSSWVIEVPFMCTNTIAFTPDSSCVEVCGDGVRYNSITTYWDDGNNVNGDGCDSACNVELGYIWLGGSTTSPDSCMYYCGDGIPVPGVPNAWDDGNTVSGDGCSLNWEIELGFDCTTPAGGPPQIWTEIWGDGIKIYDQCDDGNNYSGDGCSSAWMIENGYTWSGGSATTKDKWTEIWGDGKVAGQHEWDDHNPFSGDGCSDTWEIEKWWACSGGTAFSPDIWVHKYISVTSGIKYGLANTVTLTFNETMDQQTIENSDLSVNVISESQSLYSWTAAYISSNQVEIKVTVKSVLKGTESLEIIINNFKKFRTIDGGWLNLYEFNYTLEDSLKSADRLMKKAKGYIYYIVIGGILVMILTLLLANKDSESLWLMLNTLQLIFYLPLMTPYFPRHVRTTYHILTYVNIDFEFLSKFFCQYTGINNLNLQITKPRFLENSIETPLFLDNWSSIITSFGLTLSNLCFCSVLYIFLWEGKLKKKTNGVISSYFFNTPVRFFVEGYMDICFNSLLNIYMSTTGSIQEIISLYLSIVLFALMCVLFPIFIAAALYKNRKDITGGSERFLKLFGTLYSDFRYQKHHSNTHYYTIFMFRRLLFATTLILCTNYPEFQANMFVFGCFMTLAYQVSTHWFADPMNNALCILNEFTLASISLIQITFITDKNEQMFVLVAGWVMISIMLGNILINFLVVEIVSIVQKIKECMKNSRKRRIMSQLDPIVHVESTTINYTVDRMTIHKLFARQVNVQR